MFNVCSVLRSVVSVPAAPASEEEPAASVESCSGEIQRSNVTVRSQCQHTERSKVKGQILRHVFYFGGKTWNWIRVQIRIQVRAQSPDQIRVQIRIQVRAQSPDQIRVQDSLIFLSS